MVGQVTGHRQFPPIHRRVSQPVNPVFGRDLQRHEVPPRAAHNYLRIPNLHRSPRPITPLALVEHSQPAAAVAAMPSSLPVEARYIVPAGCNTGAWPARLD